MNKNSRVEYHFDLLPSTGAVENSPKVHLYLLLDKRSAAASPQRSPIFF